MRKIVCALMLCFALSGVAQATVVWSDSMEYSDQAALQAVWPQNPSDAYGVAPAGTSAVSLNTELYHSGSKSAKSTSALQFSEHYWGQTNVGSVVIWMYDPMTSTTGNNYGIAEVVRGNGYSAIGVVSPISQTNYTYRTNLGNWIATSIARTQGWHQIVFTFGDGGATGIGGSIYFDNQLIATNNTMYKGIWALEFGNKWQAASNETFYWDDVKLYSNIIPEPATLLLLGIGSTLFARKRA